MPPPKLTFREVDRLNWGDFEQLFAARGGPKWIEDFAFAGTLKVLSSQRRRGLR